MFKRYLLLFLMVLSFSAIGQERIEYDNRQLKRSLKKMEAGNYEKLKEMEIAALEESNGNVKGKFFEVPESNNVSQIRYIYVGRVNSCRTGGCSVSGPSGKQSFDSEFFDYFIMYDAEARIVDVRVYNYEATHGYEITSRGWLNQFDEYQGNKELKVSKNVDAISGATVSVHAITDDIIRKTQLIKEEVISN